MQRQRTAGSSGAGIIEELARLVESALFPVAEAPGPAPAQAPAAPSLPDLEVRAEVSTLYALCSSSCG